MVKNSDYLVLIPAYNEEDSIEELIIRGKKFADVCIIDDCSTDRTAAIIDKYREEICIIRHEKNTHLPGALIDGLQYASDQGYAYAITIDAGLSHNPDEIPLFMDHNNCDLTIGRRISINNAPLYRRALSIIGNNMFNLCLDFPKGLFRKNKYHDLTSGYRCYSNRAMQVILSKKIESKTVDIFLETTASIYRSGLSICEVPITYNFSNSYFTPSVIKDCLRMCLIVTMRSHKRSRADFNCSS